MVRPAVRGDFGRRWDDLFGNKRAGGMGLISGRKAFQKPMRDGVTLLNAIQDVYLSPAITVA
jgi:DhnA family fructose-bisphosphate aldolase class Ia